MPMRLHVTNEDGLGDSHYSVLNASLLMAYATTLRSCKQKQSHKILSLTYIHAFDSFDLLSLVVQGLTLPAEA